MIRKVLLIVGALMLMSSAIVFAAVADLPQTGQTACYDTAGAEIICTGTGQDGELLKGIPWPDPRFSVAGTGSNCILDTLTGLIWMKNPGVDTYSWEEALNWANDRNAANLCGFDSGWRLPNINELGSLLNQEGTIGTIEWLTNQGFENINTRYWSSTNYTPDPTQAWAMDFNNGYNYEYTKNNIIFAWPVRGPDMPGPAPVRKTGQTACWDGSGNPVNPCAGGQDGHIQAGVAWPITRFSVGGDCVADNLTDLVWAATPDGIKINWQDALNYANDRNTAGLCGYKSGWRLPNMVEMNSLVHYGETNQSVWLNAQGFTSVLPGGYWSSTSFVGNRNQGMDTSMANGQLYPYPKNSAFQYAWAVRDVFNPDISLFPGGVYFKNVIINQASIAQTITITNQGTGDLTISTIEKAGTSSTMFDVGQGATNGCILPNAKVLPGGSCTLDVTFTPDIVGPQEALLYINSNDPDTPRMQVSLFGNGVVVVMNPLEGTTGSEITVNGTGFGDKKGKVLIGGIAAKVTEWSNIQINCTVKKVPLPVGEPHPVSIITKTKETITLGDTFTVKDPELDELDDSSGATGDEIRITGNFFGIKKGKVYLEYEQKGQTKNKTCKVKTWGMDSITFVVPKTSKSFPDGSYPLKVTNKIGTATASANFTIGP